MDRGVLQNLVTCAQLGGCHLIYPFSVEPSMDATVTGDGPYSDDGNPVLELYFSSNRTGAWVIYRTTCTLQ